MNKRVMSLVFSAVLVLTGCGAGSTDGGAEKPAVQELADLTALKDPEKPQATDFDNGTVQVRIGDCTIEVPEAWSASDPYYYGETGGKVAMLYVMSSGAGVTEEVLFDQETIDSFADSFLSAFEEFTILEIKTGEINGIKMNRALAEIKYSGTNAAAVLCWFLNPGDGAVSVIAYAETENTEYSHLDDAEKILGSVTVN